MTNEEKQLLVKDICARIPFGLKCTTKANNWQGAYPIRGYLDGKIFLDCHEYYEGDDEWLVQNIVPYLRPMSSMTEEEKKEYKDMNVLDNCDEFSNIKKNIEDIRKNGEENYIQLPRTHAQDYLNSIHVDYRGLIEKGLVLEAPEGMYEN